MWPIPHTHAHADFCLLIKRKGINSQNFATGLCPVAIRNYLTLDLITMNDYRELLRQIEEEMA
jgi:hypothetical protein